MHLFHFGIINKLKKSNLNKNKGIINRNKIKLLKKLWFFIKSYCKYYKRNNNFINNKIIFNTDKDKDNNKLIKTFYSTIFYPPFCQNDKIPIKNNQLNVYNRLFEDGKYN